LVLEFINSEKVLTHLKLDKYNSSVIYILDPGHILDSCALSYWNGIPVTIINKGPLIDSTQQIELYFVVRARCNFFEISKWQSNGKEKIFFRHGLREHDFIKRVEGRRRITLYNVEREELKKGRVCE